MRELIIPDIHQRIDAADAVLARWEPEVDRVVLLGDYFDGKSSVYRGVKTGEQTLDWLLESLKQPKRVHLLGNHDLSYRYPERLRCSKHDEKLALALHRRFGERNWQAMPYALSTQGWFLSHAGLHPWFLEEASDGEDAAAAARMCMELEKAGAEESPLLQAGIARGGFQMVGGVTWLDWTDEFESVDGLNQIVGHTWSPDSVRFLGRNGEGGKGEDAEFERSWSLDELKRETVELSPPESAGSSNVCLDCGLGAVGILENGILRIEATGLGVDNCGR